MPREYRLAVAAIALGLMVFCLSVGSALAGETRVLHFGSAQRSYYVHVPATLKRGAPLLFVLHGAGGSGEQAVRLYRWQDKADAEGFVVVGPDAATVFPFQPADFRRNPRVWNDGSGRAGSNVTGSDDVGLILALAEVLERSHGIDRNRIYATGFSSGAGMAQRLGQDASDRFAAIAPVAGIMVPRASQLRRPMPVLYVSGDKDPLNPVAGGDIALPWGSSFRKEPLQAVVERWRDLDGCTGKPTLTSAPSVRVQSWSACKGGVEVRYVLINEHGHEWPGGGGSRLPPAVVGPANPRAYDATANIWTFLSRWRLQ